MILPVRSLFALALSLVSVAAFAGEPKTDPPKAKVEKKTRAELMDYGPFLTASFGLGKGTAANKGIAVRLSKDRPAHICFDTEGLRVSAAWVDDFIDYQGLAFKFSWSSARGPNIKGAVQFETKQGPGWARAGEFKDPRPFGDGPLPRDWGRYEGLYLHGEKVVFAYTIGDAKVLELPGVEFDGATALFTRTLRVGPSKVPLAMLVAENAGATASVSGDAALLTKDAEAICAAGAGLPSGATWAAKDGRLVLNLPALASATTYKVVIAKTSGGAAALKKGLGTAAEDLEALTKGGPARWTETLKTQGTLGATDGEYVVDTLTPPFENKWNAWMRFGGMDFFKDGRAALCTWSGDVWIVSGIDAKLENLEWKRYATGLFQPLGLKIVDEQIYVLCHGPILRLHDLNKDGEADFYECFNNDCHVTPNYHEFACDLDTDSAGNFYFLKGAPALAGRKAFERYTPHHGALLKVAKDGSALEVLATGFREPNGLGILPGDRVTVSDNQGNWQPECPISLVKKGGFYGMPDPSVKTAPPPRDPPLCWLPMSMDNSTGSQIWATSEKFGPLKDQMLMFSYGKCAMYSVMTDPPLSAGAPIQAGAVKLPLSFTSGVMRGKFSPVDGQLYVCGLRGWGTSAGKDGAFHRVRYTGKPVHLPSGFHVTKDGIDLTFTCSLDPATAGDTSNYGAEWFNVVASEKYGSPEYNVADAKKEGREPLTIDAAKLSADGKTVSLKIPGLKPVTNVVIKVKIKAADGAALGHDVALTINQVPK